uniref:hypothetical protein n=1 Tax=Vibrio anguillarum TaxID=55601 RepID=UPI004048A439
MKNTAYKRQYIKMIALVVGNASSRLLSLLSILLIGHLLASSEYGMFTSMYNISMALASFVAMPILQCQLKYNFDYNLKARNTIYIYTMLFSLVYFLVGCGAYYIGAINKDYIYISSAIVIHFFITQTIANTYISNNEDYKSVVSIIVNNFIFWALILINLTFFDSLNYLAISLILSILAIFLFYISTLKEPRKEENNPPDYRFIKDFVIPAFLASCASAPVLIYILNDFDKLDGEVKVYFNIAYQWFQILSFVILSVTPKLIVMFTTNVNMNFKKLAKLIQILVLMWALGLILGWIVLKLYNVIDHQYLNDVAFILISSSVLSAYSGVIGVYILSKHSMWHGAFINFLWALMMLFFYSAFEVSDSLSMSKVFLTSYFIHSILCTIYMLKKIKGISNESTIH